MFSMFEVFQPDVCSVAGRLAAGRLVGWGAGLGQLCWLEGEGRSRWRAGLCQLCNLFNVLLVFNVLKVLNVLNSNACLLFG